MEKRWENEFRTTLICVDSCRSGELTGRLYNSYIQGGESFRSLMELILRLDELLDQMQFPQSYTERRGFRRESLMSSGQLPVMELQTGICGTFSLKVLFRQNASWQGTLNWVEGRQEESFRSVLELIHLLRSALQEEPGAVHLA